MAANKVLPQPAIHSRYSATLARVRRHRDSHMRYRRMIGELHSQLCGASAAPAPTAPEPNSNRILYRGILLAARPLLLYRYGKLRTDAIAKSCGSSVSRVCMLLEALIPYKAGEGKNQVDSVLCQAAEFNTQQEIAQTIWGALCSGLCGDGGAEVRRLERAVVGQTGELTPAFWEWVATSPRSAALLLELSPASDLQLSAVVDHLLASKCRKMAASRQCDASRRTARRHSTLYQCCMM